ncbi:hypothetical protein [Brachybacterium sp. JB7]|nr:hypothetical protein [Brachybacterium sp. JB7]
MIRGDAHVRFDRAKGLFEVEILVNVTGLIRFGAVEQEIGPGTTTWSV